VDKLIDELEVNIRYAIHCLQVIADRTAGPDKDDFIHELNEGAHAALAALRYIGVEDEPMS
jgi:hypothetical protein